MKKNIFILLGVTLTTYCIAQTEKSYKSIKHSFTINYPNEFVLFTSKAPEVDFAVKDGYGGSILENRTILTDPDFYDDMTEKQYKETFEQSTPGLSVVKFYKTTIAGKKAIISYSYVPNGSNPYKQIVCYVINGKYLYTISAGTLIKYFDKEEKFFLKTVNSIKFN